MTDIFEEGSEVVLTEDYNEDGRKRSKHSMFIVEDYISAEDAEDGVPFYWLSSPNGNYDATIPASLLTLVRTKEQMDARTIPTVKEVTELVSQNVLGSIGDHFISEADIDGDSVHFYGTAEGGLKFSFTLKVSELERTIL